MSSLFSSINIGRRALQVQQKSIEVTGHNIANSNVKGYSRQRVVQTTEAPAYGGASSGSLLGDARVGQGVKVQSIDRITDEFVVAQIWKEMRELGRWNTTYYNAAQVERIFNEPGKTGIRSRLDELWSAFQELNSSPSSRSTRVEVKERAEALVDIVTHTHRQLVALQRDVNGHIRETIDEINSLSDQIAQLNREIEKVQVTGVQPNDLLDRRDQLMSRLAEISGATASELPGQPFKVTLGGITLVAGGNSEAISIREETGIVRKAYPHWDRISMDVDVVSGELKGLLDVRDELIQGSMSRLDEFAITFSKAINEVHRAGYTLDEPPLQGVDFFREDITSADEMSLSRDILESVTKIAASLSGDPGNGDNAADIAERILSPIFEDGTFTPRDFLTSLVTDLGIRVQASERGVEKQEILLAHLGTQRDSVAGVSLDEEVANLVQFQHAYGAAARFISAVDEILELIINRMGVVGR